MKDKPHPALALAACSAWGVPPESCLMVGDSMDDMRLGRAAGMSTCLLRTPPAAAEVAAAAAEGAAPLPLADEVDFAVSTLAELGAMMEDAVRLE